MFDDLTSCFSPDYQIHTPDDILVLYIMCIFATPSVRRRSYTISHRLQKPHA
jgi:hypothetical protein